MKQHYLVCYDISNNKRRYRVDKILAQYGTRIQLSVYDIVLNNWQIDALREQLRAIIETSEDRVHYYPVCVWCRKNSQLLGAAFLSTDKSYYCICQ